MGEDFAIHSELQFILDRSRQLADFFSSKHSLVFSDYVPQKSLIFSKINLTKTQFNVVSNLSQILYRPFESPDLIIFIEREVDELIENILKRGRVFEREIDETYIQSIMEGYERWLKQLQQPVLRIKANQIDMTRPKQLINSFQTILSEKYIQSEVKINLNQLMKVN